MPDAAAAYARRLLRSLGLELPVGPGPDPAVSWAASGGMALTSGTATAGVAAALDGALLALRALAPGAELPDARLLGERAALSGLGPAGRVSCGGATRLLRCADGLVALALARPEDLELVPALVGREVVEPWAAVSSWALSRSARDVRDRTVLLGLACSVPGETAPGPVPWRIAPLPPAAGDRVLDLTALWAGPLSGSLLAACGLRRQKIEDPDRPDGSRRGPAAFFDLLCGGAGWAPLDDLAGLLDGAAVVLEASRPRALQQRGIRAEAFRGVWVSITGHGRDQPHRIGYGDEAGVAGGLLADPPGFVADAVADALTGVHAAVAVLGLRRAGRGGLVDLALSRTAAVAASLPVGPVPIGARAARPWARTPVQRAPRLA